MQGSGSEILRPFLRRPETDPRHWQVDTHELLTWYAQVGANPWLVVPTTLRPGEMRMIVEYLAAPAEVGMGRLRAAQGRPEPWTTAFDDIVIEPGNEVWNPHTPYPIQRLPWARILERPLC